MQRPGRRLYVYYRVDAAVLEATLATARRLQAQLLAAHPGVQAELLRRPDVPDGQITVMEAYAEQAPGAMPPDLAQRLEGLATTLPRPRHAEWFEPA
jgi:hypothetical protein